MPPKTATHNWQFQSRFRRGAFGWRSQPAIQRVKEAVSEIKKVARKDPMLAAEGAVRFLERVSPALEHVDSSSGAIGTAVNRATTELVSLIATAPTDVHTRAGWLDRLFDAHAVDEIPYIERLSDHWGELCVSKETASLWANRLLEPTRMALSPAKDERGFFHGTTACLSALLTAARYDEILELLAHDAIWPYKQWAAKSLHSQGRRAEAICYAEACRSSGPSEWEIDTFCEELLLESGLADEAYRRYGLNANRAGTYLAWFRAVDKKYPHKAPREILADLVALTPGEEGKWFAAAKDANLFDEAVALVSRAPTDPRTLTRAARDFAEKRPAFAIESGIAALRWIAEGYGYEITGGDVLSAYQHTMKAAAQQGSVDATQKRISGLVAAKTAGARFVTKILQRELDRVPDRAAGRSKITNPSRRIVVETKYYATPNQSHHGSKKIRSGHLYQVLTYIEHLSATTGPEPTGLLLYARVGEDWRLEYRLRGQRLLVRTLDLDRDWQAIHRDLLAMTGELAETPDRLTA